MVSINTRVATFCAISWLTTACVSSGAVHPKELTDDGKTIAPHSPNTVTSDELDRAGDDAIVKTLSAKVPGVWVSMTASGSLAIRVRSSSSINGNTEPLYIIDGTEVQAGPNGALNGINPHDIASIEVLKDAASLSYYGVRAANGVIVIKTKQASN
jgi:TonB-dependent SusC/RagA subfamily outer membrane receptor